MDEDDFIALIDEMSTQLDQIGLGEIANEANYVETNPETGETYLYRPQARLIAMLDAFERQVAIEDRSLLVQSLRTINELVEGEGPQRVVVEIPDVEERTVGTDPDSAGGRQIDLTEAPDLSEVRTAIGKLKAQLLNDGFGFDGEGA